MSQWEYDFERRRIGHWVHDLSYYNFVATWTPTKIFSGQCIFLDMLSECFAPLYLNVISGGYDDPFPRWSTVNILSAIFSHLRKPSQNSDPPFSRKIDSEFRVKFLFCCLLTKLMFLFVLFCSLDWVAYSRGYDDPFPRWSTMNILSAIISHQRKPSQNSDPLIVSWKTILLLIYFFNILRCINILSVLNSLAF